MLGTVGRGYKGATPLNSEPAPSAHKAAAKAGAPLDVDARITAVEELILSRLDDDKAQDVVFIDLKGKSAMADGPMGGPPPGGGPGGPGGPPPGGPPPGQSSEDDESDSNSLALDLLNAAKSAYSAKTQTSDDLLTTRFFTESASETTLARGFRVASDVAPTK